jgi:FkbM family methyltransferase
MKKFLYRIWETAKIPINIYIIRDKQYIIRRKFKKESIKLKLRTNYKLDPSSIVFDLGGYKGEWSEEIYKKYKPTIYIFEPIKDFYVLINQKFLSNSKVKVFNYGLSNSNEKKFISLKDDASSTFLEGNKIEIELKDIGDTIKNLKLSCIDLIKINIEGGEYEVLPRLIETGQISIFKNIQVQFHDFIPHAVEMRNNIRKELNKTHHLTYDYPFVFENWEINK